MGRKRKDAPVPVVFRNKMFGTLSAIIDDDGSPWFILDDISRSLDMANMHMSLSRYLDDEDYTTMKVKRDAGVRSVSVVTESGLYNLMMHTRKDNEYTRGFKRWVTKEVLPEIRRTGMYSFNPYDDEGEPIPGAIDMLYNQTRMLQGQIDMLEQRLEKTQDIVDFANVVSTDKGTIAMDELAKMISDDFLNGETIGRNTLYEFLRDQDILMSSPNKKNRPYQRFIDKGWFTYSETVTPKGNVTYVVRVTQKGTKHIIKHYLKYLSKKQDLANELGIVNLRKNKTCDEDGFVVLMPKIHMPDEED